MSWPLRQSTAAQYIPLGPFVDSTDGNTAETALTIANTDIKLQKYGATTEVNKNVGGATHLANGRYYTVLDATDSNTLGPMRISSHVAGALGVWLDACVYPQAKYDAEYLGIGYVNSDIAGVKDNAQTAQGYAAGTLTLANGTVSSAGDWLTINSAGQGVGQTVQITSINTSVPTAKVASVDPAFSPTLTGTVVYTTRIGARTPSIAPEVALTPAERTTLIAALFAFITEGSMSFLQAIRGMCSAAMGKSNGLDTATARYRDLADTKDRITATVDADGNRTAVTRDLT